MSSRLDESIDPGAKSRRDGERLLAAVQELSYLRDLEGVMAVVRRVARELAEADGVSFVLRDGGQVFYAEENAIGPLWKGRRFPLECCISGWVILNRVPAVIPDIFVDPRIPHDVYRSTFVKSLAMIPIRPLDPIGAIGAYWADNHLASDHEIGLLQALAGSTSVALANAELYAEARAAQAAAEAANRAKDAFLTILSHELRTPLTSILGWARILRERAAEPQVVSRGIEVIERNSKAQARIIDDLLDASRILADGLDVSPQSVDLGLLLDQMVLAMRPVADARQVALGCERPGEAIRVAGDPDRISQILGNLLSNAFKFTPKGGRVDVTCARDDGRALVSVRDTGAGIAADYLPKVFDLFSQQDSSHARAHGGLGLGLFIVRHLVEKQGGEIAVESDGIGHGTTVTVRFALARA
jgi:two-component system CheB/CheR fusion protein